MRRAVFPFLFVALITLTAAADLVHAADDAETAGVARIQEDAAAVMPLVKTPLARHFLEATADLPSIADRTLYRDPAKGKIISAADADRLAAEGRKTLKAVTVGENVYYNTRYGSPLAYVRPLEVLGENGPNDIADTRLLDFGYGTVGHLRLLASMGAQTVGVDVDPLLPVLYGAPGDTGVVTGRDKAPNGSIRLVDGQWPADATVKRVVGGSFDLILSKNTLKNGYLHPSEKVDKRMLVDLGVSDEAFVHVLFAALKPGGRVLIYNLSPAPSRPGTPYKPWADGRCPFPRAMLEAAGFRIHNYDKNDDVAARQMARTLGWDKGVSPMDIDNDLFALYTLLQK